MHTDLHNPREHDDVRKPVASCEHPRACVTLAFPSRSRQRVMIIW